MVYLRLLRVAHVAPLMAAMVLGRLPIGVNPLAVVLFVRAERGDFGTAGLVSGALALGSGLAAPVVGRAVDRLGPRLIVPVAVGHALGLGALVLLVPTGAPVVTLAVVGFVAGGLLPPVSSVLRVLYPTLLRGRTELLPTAFALDAALTDLVFAGGPLLVAAALALGSPQGALAVSAAGVVIGSVAFVAVMPPPERRPEGAAPPRLGGLGALATPGVLVLTATMLPLGLSWGVIEVMLPAFARSEGSAASAGVLLASWSLASAAGGFAYGMVGLRHGLLAAHSTLVVLLALLTALLLLSTSPLAMALLLVPVGLPIGPIVATRNQLAGLVARAGSETEAYTWVLTAMVAGIAAGAALGGALVDAGGWRAATTAAVVAAAAGAVLSLVGRTRLDGAVAAAPG